MLSHKYNIYLGAFSNLIAFVFALLSIFIQTTTKKKWKFPLLATIIIACNIECYFIESINGFFFCLFLELVQANANFKLECPLLKGKEMIVKPFNISFPFLPPNMKHDIQKVFTFILFAERPPVPILSIDVPAMKIEID